MKTKQTQAIYRQGDVLIVAVSDLPNAVQAEKREGDIILAHGEVTGHAHRINSEKARMWSAGAERFLQAMEAVALTHEEHATVTIPPGTYRIAIQTEYTPQAVRRVAD